MKYKFNKIFHLLIKQKEIAGKPHVVPDLRLLGPNLGRKTFFFFEVSAILDVTHCPKLQFCAISRKTNDANLRKWRKT